ncbi:hypothetical protein HMI56_004116 [Coelomomyces lativittatus]|nr:hypothetical protein HMI56_004116 [Coelomomyces lativittatus]
MCGILGIFNYQGDGKLFRDLALKLSKRLRHRGPDWTGIEIFGHHHALCHERLSIVDLGK